MAELLNIVLRDAPAPAPSTKAPGTKDASANSWIR
jgi:hypothetical protein